MTADKPATVTYSIIYQGEDAQYGKLIVCIRGIHNVQAPNFMPLEYEFEVMRWIAPSSSWAPLEDRTVGQELVCLATTFWYMMRGTIVTSDARPTREGNPGEAIWQLDIPGYGVTIVESCGLFEYDDDVYHIFVAHPGPKVYLTVIQEVLNTTPPEWIGIRLNDKELVGAIIDVYLIQIGAIEGRGPVSEEEGPDEGDDIDTSVC